MILIFYIMNFRRSLRVRSWNFFCVDQLGTVRNQLMVLRSVTSSARPKEQGQTPICWKFMHHFPALSSLAILT